MQKFIERPDVDGEECYILQSETSYPYLHEYIQKMGNPETSYTAGEEEKALEGAFQFMAKNVQSIADAVHQDASIPDDKKDINIVDKLTNIRDRILGLKTIFIELDNEDNAYIIFETLNTRGKDLEVSDLVKNHLMRNIGPKNKNVDLARDKWQGIRSEFEKSAADIDINAFLLHYWLSKRNFIAEKKLFKDIKSNIQKGDAFNFLEDLVKYSILYRVMSEPSAHKWAKTEWSMRESLEALLLFRVRQQMPMILSLLNEYFDDKVNRKWMLNTLRSIEAFHFIFTAVTSQRSSGGISQMYSAGARGLVGIDDNNERIRMLREFGDKLRQRIPSYEEFEVYFRDIIYSDNYTKERSLVRYILKEIDKHDRKDLVVNYDSMTIEHLAPQNPKKRTNISDEHVAMLGNLVLVPEKLNEQLGNKTFDDKRRILMENDVALDQDILNAEKWSESEIEKRTKNLAKYSYEKVWKF